MIPQVLSALGIGKLPAAGPAPAGNPATGFALLMQGLKAGQGAVTIETAEAPLAKANAEAEIDITLPEDIDLTTPEGLMAALDHVIAGLEAAGVPLNTSTVVTAFADALGEAGVEQLADLSVVVALEDPALVEGLQARIVDAVRRPTPMDQLGIASAGLGMVRGEPARTSGQKITGAERGTAVVPMMTGINQAEGGVPELTASSERPTLKQEAAAEMTLREAGARNTQADPDAAFQPAGKAQDQLNAAFAKLAEAAQSPGGTEPAPRDLPPLQAPQVTAPQAPARVAAVTPPPAPATPEAQLMQHVGQQIRTQDVGEQKFRFSLTPYGMGEIEVEIHRSENGRMQIAMTTESASVLNVLRHDRDTLLDALQSRGISANSGDLDFQTFGERGRQGGRETAQRAGSETPEARDIKDDPALVSRPVVGTGLLDILT